MFTIGNIVRFKNTEVFQENIKFVIVEDTPDGYVVMNANNGELSCFWKEEELELLDAGDPIFVKSLAAIYEKNHSEQRTIKWIKENWKGDLDLNWNSILFLYEKIDYDIEINTGEEFKFYWYVIYPIFKEIFFGTKRKALKETKKTFTRNFVNHVIPKVIELYEEVNNE